ncbi:hypothetical protein BDP27DRAFT_1424032 [Rhodocollybia butyracea]|uniref:Uncharacterized protein n=1 Tax=Rhodocollybia butyracea TaxID=206335 RepID=A0A9P5PMZ1_9AGAR|nr:hypothetical protein BDP27DRAFT_1424032 [Rhodocollybia butyracea]
MDITESDLLRNHSQREDDGSGHAKSTVTLSLPSSVKDLPSVAKLYSFFNQLTYSDGLVGALLATTKEFLTSPNCDYLPDPPLGSTRNLYRRNDARYGQDDPICWPQPYNPRYPFYAAISKKPTDLHSFESSIMWLDLREGDLSFTSQGEERKEGIVKSEIISALQRKITLLKPRVSVFYEGNPDSTRWTFLKENIDSINLFLTRLGTVSATLRDQQPGLTELQRAYLTAKAILDFHRLVEKPGISDTPATVDTKEFWRKMISYPFLNLVERNAKVTGKLQIQLEAQIYVEDSIKAYNANMAFRLPSLEGAADPVIACRLIREICMINFHSELMHTDKLLDQSRPQPSRDLTIAELDVAVSRHQRERDGLIEQIFFYIGLEPDPSIDYGIVAVDWGTRYRALKKFWALLDTWRGDKSLLWRRGIDMDLIKMEYAEGAQWERLLAEFYVQNVLSVLGRPLSLPRRL